MKRILTIFFTIIVVALLSATGAIAQDTGDFRSTANGDWSAAATWETFDGSSWVAAGSSPDGSESITIQATDTVSVDVDVSISGNVTVDGDGPAAGGLLAVTDGSLTVADGGTYEHARDAGSIPIGTWEEGSTVLLTGILTDDPDNVDQDFYNFTWNNSGQVENINIGWDGYTLRGNMTVLNTNGNQFRLTSAGDNTRMITIAGDVIVDGENAEFTTTGSGSLADYEVTVLGNLEVINGGFLSASRGSSGRAIWYLHGDLTVTDAQLGDSDDHDQEKSFVFAADTTAEGAPSQNISVSNISYDGPVHFFVSDSSGVYVDAESEFLVDATLVNEGLVEVDADGELIFGGEATYIHAQDGGTVPTATWNEGSVALFPGIVTSGPGNASQDFYNLVIDSPGNIENNDFNMNGNTIHGDIDVLNTGTARIYLTNPDSFEDREITIMGDLYVDVGDGAFSTQGTGSGESSVTINHHGNITVDSGNFSIGRGSGPLVYWYLHEGHFFFNAGETQNSNPRSESAFIFTGEDSTQILDVSEDVEISNLPFTVDTSATLDIGDSNFSGMSDNIVLRSGGNLATSFAAGFEDNLDAENLSLSSEAGYILNGTVEQQTGFNLPLTIASLTIDNEAGVIQSRDITINEFLRLSSGVFDNTNGFTLGENAEIIYDGGSLVIPVSNEIVDEIPDKFSLEQNYPNPFNPTTTIQYNLPEQAHVSLKVYDITGREVAELVENNMNAGSHTFEWDASNLASGVYLYRITAGSFTSVRKLTLLK